MASITIHGLPELQRKLDNILPAVKRGIKAGTVHVKGKINQYPPSTQANTPKTYAKGRRNTWYERGYGSKRALAGGGWRGRKSSEMLGRKWTVKFENDGLTGVVGNNVSYGPYVQDTKEQTAPMKDIGWKTTGTVADEESPTVLRFIQAQVDKELAK